MSFWDEKETKRLLKELPFYNMSIEKPKLKNFSDVDKWASILWWIKYSKTVKPFKNYGRSFNIEIIKNKDGNMNDSLVQLEASKPVIKDLFKDLLIEMKGFKYQITLKVLLSKQKQSGDTEFSTVYFNSTAKTVINTNIYGLNKSF